MVESMVWQQIAKCGMNQAKRNGRILARNDRIMTGNGRIMTRNDRVMTRNGRLMIRNDRRPKSVELRNKIKTHRISNPNTKPEPKPDHYKKLKDLGSNDDSFLDLIKNSRSKSS